MIRLATLSLVLLAAGGAQAASRHLSITAKQLDINSPCARQVVVTPDASPGQITVDAVADNQQEVDQLELTGGDTAKLTVPDACWHPTLSFAFQHTLALAVHIPPHSPLSIDESGSPTYQIGDLAAPLTLALSGSVRLTAESATALDAEMSGSAQVDVGHANGPLKAEISGAGTLNVASLTAPKAELDISGKGDIHFGTGNIGKLTVESSGVSSVRADGTVGDAEVELSGVSSVRIARLTGNLSKEVSGMADVQVGTREPARRMITALLALQLFHVLFLALHDWVPLGRLNNVAAVRAADPLAKLLAATLISTLPFLIGLAASAHFAGAPLPSWLRIYLWISYGLLFLGELEAWWIPCLLIAAPARAARYRTMFAGTHAFLPARNGITPNTLHVILHTATVAMLLLLAVAVPL